MGNFGDNRTLANSNTNSITIDTKAPVLTSLSMVTNNADKSRAKTGDNLTLSFSANENLDQICLKLKLNCWKPKCNILQIKFKDYLSLMVSKLCQLEEGVLRLIQHLFHLWL